jgi:quercetin dioxygenase-like cupin family protein
MTRIPAQISAALFGMAMLVAPFAARTDDVPDALSVEWQGQKPCEKVFEDAKIRIARCTFPPGSKHVRHSHTAYLSYVLRGGKAEVQDEKGTRQVEARTGSYVDVPPGPWYELMNVGDTTLQYLVVERKYQPVPVASRRAYEYHHHYGLTVYGR